MTTNSSIIFSPIKNFKNGFFSFLKALLLILTSPSLLSLTIIPLSINILIYILLFVIGIGYLDQINQTIYHQLETSISTSFSFVLPLVHWTLKIVAWVILILVSAITFTTISSILAAPFNEILSRRTRIVLSKDSPSSLSSNNNQLQINFISSIKIEIRRTVIMLCGGVFALILGLIPFLQLPALVLGALLISFEYFGIALSSNEPQLRQQITYIFKNPMQSLGFGTFVILIMALPFTSIFYIPLAVVAATTLDFNKANR